MKQTHLFLMKVMMLYFTSVSIQSIGLLDIHLY